MTIGLIGILLAIILPSLGRVRGTALETVTRSNLRQIGSVFDHYTQAYKSFYPHAPEGTWFLLTPPDELPEYLSGGYWDLRAYWVALMHDIAPWREHFRTWVGPGTVRDGDVPWRRERIGRQGTPSYFLSDTFFARPALWSPGAIDDPRLYHGVKLSDVQAPSSKVMVYDNEYSHLPLTETDHDRTAMLFADGHVAVEKLSEATPPAQIPFKPDTQPVQDTPNGVHGRDY